MEDFPPRHPWRPLTSIHVKIFFSLSLSLFFFKWLSKPFKRVLACCSCRCACPGTMTRPPLLGSVNSFWVSFSALSMPSFNQFWALASCRELFWLSRGRYESSSLLHPTLLTQPGMFISQRSWKRRQCKLCRCSKHVCVPVLSVGNSVTPVNCPPGSSPMEFSRREYWSGLPFPPPGDLPNSEIELVSPALAGRFFTTEPPGKPRYRERKWLIHLHLVS